MDTVKRIAEQAWFHTSELLPAQTGQVMKANAARSCLVRGVLGAAGSLAACTAILLAALPASRGLVNNPPGYEVITSSGKYTGVSLQSSCKSAMSLQSASAPKKHDSGNLCMGM